MSTCRVNTVEYQSNQIHNIIEIRKDELLLTLSDRVRCALSFWYSIWQVCFFLARTAPPPDWSFVGPSPACDTPPRPGTPWWSPRKDRKALKSCPAVSVTVFITVEWWGVSVPVWCQILRSETVVWPASTLPLLLYQTLWPSQAPAQHTPSPLVSDDAVQRQSNTDRLFQTQNRIRNIVLLFPPYLFHYHFGH